MNETLKNVLQSMRQAVMATIALLILCGFLFPCILTGISTLIFPHQANGNLIAVNG